MDRLIGRQIGRQTGRQICRKRKEQRDSKTDKRRVKTNTLSQRYTLASVNTTHIAISEYNTDLHRISCDTARSLEDKTRNRERNAFRNPEWWGDFSQLVKIEKIEFFGISRYKVGLKFWFDFQFPGISRYRFKLRFLYKLNLQLTKISPPLRISIGISLTISSLGVFYQKTGCSNEASDIMW